MARQEIKYEVNQFTGGLNTDTTELTPVQNTSIDEDNFNLLKEGTRRRRLGFDVESSTFADLNIDTVEKFIGSHRWENVGKQLGVNFEVVQAGSWLHFFDASGSVFASSKKSFTVNLNLYKAPGANRTDVDGVSMASGKGALFVTGEKVKPFYIEYNRSTDSISVTVIDMKIRDLTQLDTQDPERGTLTPQRRYDLLNQGWYQENVIIGSSTQIVKIKTKSSNPDTSIPGYEGTILDGFIERFGTAPPKTKPWWIGKGTITVDIHIKKPGIFNDTKETREVDAFSKEAFDLYFGGNTVAPLGHYLVDPFFKDRASVSGVNGISTETEVKRPNAVAFYGGRAFYGINNTIYFSQIILDDLDASGRCYQDADPTAEDTVGLVPSDGGVITIPDMGSIIRFFVVESALIIFADNGIWTLYSQQGRGFSATEFAVDYVTSLGATGYHSIVDVEGFPFYWGDKGIYMLQPIDERVAYEVVDLSDRKIKNYIQDNISYLSKKYAKGAYDLTNKRVIWLWKSSTDPSTNRFEYDRVLNYSLNFQAFFPYSMAIHTPGDGNDSRYAVCGIVEGSSVATETVTLDVVVENIDDEVVEWHYPFRTDFSDFGPNSLDDATSSSTIATTSPANIFAYPQAFVNAGSGGVIFPTDAAIDAGTNDWTLEFRLTSPDYFGLGGTRKNIFFMDNQDNSPEQSISLTAFNPVSSSPIFRLDIATDGTNPDFIDTNFTPQDNGVYGISITRNGNNIYMHVNGELQGSSDVTGKAFNFKTAGLSPSPQVRMFISGGPEGGGSMTGAISDVRWTNTARYSGTDYAYNLKQFPITGEEYLNVIDGNGDQVVVQTEQLTENEVGLKYLVLKDSVSGTFASLGAGDFSDTTFVDWDSTTFEDDYTSYIETFYHLTDDSMLYMQAPWIYTYIKRSSTTFPAAEGDGSIAEGETGGPW